MLQIVTNGHRCLCPDWAIAAKHSDTIAWRLATAPLFGDLDDSLGPLRIAVLRQNMLVSGFSQIAIGVEICQVMTDELFTIVKRGKFDVILSEEKVVGSVKTLIRQ